MIQPAFEILNQRGTPMFFSDIFANRPTAGIVGRIFISTDTYAFYRDTGTGWDLIGGPGTGTITGSGTIGTLPIWNGTQVIGDSSLLEGASKFTTTKDFQADGYYLTGMTGGSGALYWTSDRVTLANYNATGNVVIEAGGGQNAQTISGTNLSTTFYGNIIRNGGLSTQFLKADGSLDSNTYNTGSGAASQVAFWSGTNALSGENNLWWDSTNNYLGINTNTPSVPLDVHHSGNNGAILNQTTGTNNNLIAFQTSGNGRWRIGNFYNAGADDYGIFDVIGSIQPFTIAKTTGQTFIGSKITASGRLVINSASSDAHIQVVGASAPSIRIDNAGSGATQRFVMGLATATNNFIQGSTAGDICISTASSSPLLFGMWQSINASEVMRISTSNNLLLGSVVDNGYKLNVNGAASINGSSRIGNAVAASILTPSTGLDVIVGSGSPTSPAFQVWDDNSLSTSRLIVTRSGNFGLGVSPSAWSGFTALQVQNLGLWGIANDNYANFSSNTYYDGGNNRYIYTQAATLYQQYRGSHIWFNAPSGSAGNIISFTQAMTLDASGNLGIGSTNPAALISLTEKVLKISNPNIASIYLESIGNRIWANYVNSAGTLTWYDITGAATRMSIPSSGNVLIGTTTDAGYKLDLIGDFRALTNGGGDNNSLFEGNGSFLKVKGRASYAALVIDGTGTNNWEWAIRGETTLRLNENGNNRICIASGGNFGINVTTPTSKLHLSGTLRVDGQTAATAGGSSGQHLIINCDGTTYKIALLNN